MKIESDQNNELNQLMQDDLALDDSEELFPDLDKPNKKKVISQSLVFVLFFLIFGISSYLVYSVISSQDADSTSQAFRQSGEQVADVVKAMLPSNYSVDQMPDQINILTLGVVGSNHPGSQLTDSIVIASLRPKERGLTVVSLPRDLLVKIPGRNTYSKINSIYNSYGVDPLKQKITEITDLAIDHWLVVDLTTVEEIIDTIDGLNIYVPKDIYDPYFPTSWLGYQVFSIKEGWRYMNGKTALQYMRTRYTSPGGDFDRMGRQQQVLRAIKQKVFALNPLWDLPTYLDIFSSLNSKIKTDLSLSQIKNFFYVAKDLDINKIKTVPIDRDNNALVTGSSVMMGEVEASVIVPKAGYENYTDIKKYIRDLINR